MGIYRDGNAHLALRALRGSHIYSWILLSFTEPTLQLSAATLLAPVCGFTSHHSALCHAPPALFPPAMARYRQRPLPASSDFGYDPLQGTRVGEASHPGPVPFSTQPPSGARLLNFCHWTPTFCVSLKPVRWTQFNVRPVTSCSPRTTSPSSARQCLSC